MGTLTLQGCGCGCGYVNRNVGNAFWRMATAHILEVLITVEFMVLVVIGGEVGMGAGIVSCRVPCM